MPVTEMILIRELYRKNPDKREYPWENNFFLNRDAKENASDRENPDERDILFWQRKC